MSASFRLATGLAASVTAAFLLAPLIPDAFPAARRTQAPRVVDVRGAGRETLLPALLGLADDSRARGRFLYAEHCAGCHGATGAGDGPLAVLLHPRPRDFTADAYKLRSTASGMPTDADLRRVLERGLPGSSMPSFSFLTPSDLRALVAHTKALSRTTEDGRAVERFEQNPAGPSLPVPAPPEFTPALVARGAEVYRRLDCQSCHGPEGRGDGPQAAGLRDGRGRPLAPRDLTRDPYLGGEDPEAVYLRIAAGIGGTPMVAYPDAVVTPADRWALVAHVLDVRRRAVGPAGPDLGAPPVLSVRTLPALPEGLDDRAWADVPATTIALTTIWRRSTPTRRLVVKAAHDAESVAVLLAWENGQPAREEGRVQDYVDRAALQFSLTAEPGFVGMGDPWHPVNLWLWSAGARGVAPADATLLDAAYPSRKRDLHPDAGPLHASAEMAGNPLAGLRARSFEETNARGPGRHASQPASEQDVTGEARWVDGTWRVVFRRRMEPQTDHDADLRPGREIPVALAVWDGRLQDRDGQKSFSAWHRFRLDP